MIKITPRWAFAIFERSSKEGSSFAWRVRITRRPCASSEMRNRRAKLKYDVAFRDPRRSARALIGAAMRGIENDHRQVWRGGRLNRGRDGLWRNLLRRLLRRRWRGLARGRAGSGLCRIRKRTKRAGDGNGQQEKKGNRSAAHAHEDTRIGLALRKEVTEFASPARLEGNGEILPVPIMRVGFVLAHLLVRRGILRSHARRPNRIRRSSFHRGGLDFPGASRRLVREPLSPGPGLFGPDPQPNRGAKSG